MLDLSFLNHPIMKKHFLSFLFFFVNAWALAGINGPDPIKKIVREIAGSNVFEISATVGYAGTPSQQNVRYRELLEAASVSQLQQLATKNKNAVVRLYAFKGLVSQQKNIPPAIIEQFKNDSTLVVVISGDIAEKRPVSAIASGFLY